MHTQDSWKRTRVHVLMLETCTCDHVHERHSTRRVIVWAAPPLMQTLHACIMQCIRWNKAHHQFHTSRESSIMGRLSIKTRTGVIHLWRKGISVQHIVERLAEEDISILQSALYELLKKYSRCHTIADLKELHGHEFCKNTTDLLMIRWLRTWSWQLDNFIAYSRSFQQLRHQWAQSNEHASSQDVYASEWSTASYLFFSSYRHTKQKKKVVRISSNSGARLIAFLGPTL